MTRESNQIRHDYMKEGIPYLAHYRGSPPKGDVFVGFSYYQTNQRDVVDRVGHWLYHTTEGMAYNMRWCDLWPDDGVVL